jgi:hypothetical protein
VLPFLKSKKDGMVTGIIVKDRQPDEKTEENDKDSAIHACASDLISAVHSRDVEATAEAMRSAFEILEEMPHDEIEHEPHSYEAQTEE